MPPELSDDHVAAICQVLIDHQVVFVVIGGVAARLHNTGHSTVDIDICPDDDAENLFRLRREPHLNEWRVSGVFRSLQLRILNIAHG